MRTARCVVACLTVVLAACGESVVPIGPFEAATFDRSLVGAWKMVNPDKGVPTLIAAELRAPEYFVELNDSSGLPLGSPDGPIRARVFITKVAGVSFVSAQPIGSCTAEDGGPCPSEPGYDLFRYDLVGDTLRIKSLSTEAHKLKTSAELYEFIAARLTDPTLYKDSAKYVRMNFDS